MMKIRKFHNPSKMLEKDKSINVFGKKLSICCNNMKTGFFRNGMCDTCKEDQGVHTVCVLATEEFLHFSKSVGNDLSTPRIEFQFLGVKPGDRWCLCALRWKNLRRTIMIWLILQYF